MNTIQRLAAAATFHGQDFHGIGLSATCCDQHQHQCNQGRDCPARHPAEAATEIGCDDDPRWLDCVTPRTGALIVALSAAVVIAIALGSTL